MAPAAVEVVAESGVGCVVGAKLVPWEGEAVFEQGKVIAGEALAQGFNLGEGLIHGGLLSRWQPR